MPDIELPAHVKSILKRIPGIQSLNGIRHTIIRIRELSNLIKGNKTILFRPYSRLGKNTTLTRTMAQEVVKEWLDLYGIVHLRGTTIATVRAPADVILLYASQALLEIPPTHEAYLKSIRRETRKDIRLAERNGYECKEFVWNDHLDEIYEINTSKEIRQCEPMRGWYREAVQPRHHCEEELLYQKYYGAFKDGKLYAYLHYWICGDFAVGKHFIGHAGHLKYGIMNALMSYTVQECTGNSELRWFYYGAYNEGPLGSFKRRAGCQPYAILLDLLGDQELLKYSERRVKTWWRL